MTPLPTEPALNVATITPPDGPSFQIACREKSVRPDGLTFEDPVMDTYRQGILSPLGPLVEIARSMLRPGHRVLDVGAHIGGFSLLASSLGCHVVAVEASPWNADLVRQSIELNGFKNMRVFNVAAADEPGELQFAPLGPWGQVWESVDRPSVAVRAVRIDDLLEEIGWDRVDFVKLDVEGYEIRALRGMSRLLQRADAPSIFFESNDYTLKMYNETPANLLAQLRQFGYEIRSCDANGERTILPVDFEQTAQNVDYLAEKPRP